jgi:UPF0755 protein
MRTIKRFIVAASVVGIIGGGWFLWWFFSGNDSYPASIFVEPGDAFHTIVVKLRDRELVNSPWLFSKVAILLNVDRHLIPGRYDFSADVSYYDIFKKIKNGDIAVMSVTIPEGYTVGQIGRLLSQVCGVDPDRFGKLVRDSEYLASLGIEAGFAEGYLFPETYNFAWGIPPMQAIETMVDELYARLTDKQLLRAGEIGFTPHELLTLASIVEAEARHDEEKPRIASVYLNRFRIGMKLQADPTVIYGMGGLDRPLMVKDYKFPSLYNTYVHHGLPPGPICSPGMASINAVLYPDTSDYLYFVADGNGYHIFSKTYNDHLRATRRVKQEQRSR